MTRGKHLMSAPEQATSPTTPTVTRAIPATKGTDPADGRLTIRPASGRARRGPRVPRGVRRAAGPVGLVLAWYLAGATGLLSTSVLASPVDVVRQALELTRDGELPDAIVWASARVHAMLLVTRDAKGFPEDDPGVRIPYRI